MKLVINIPDRVYKCVMDGVWFGSLYEELKNGVPVDTCGDCVSRKDVIKAVYDWLEFYDPFEPDEPDLDDVLGNLPPVEPERKVGKWIVKIEDWNRWTCSECGFSKRTDIHVSLGYKFCPNCGSKMEVDG